MFDWLWHYAPCGCAVLCKGTQIVLPSNYIALADLVNELTSFARMLPQRTTIICKYSGCRICIFAHCAPRVRNVLLPQLYPDSPHPVCFCENYLHLALLALSKLIVNDLRSVCRLALCLHSACTLPALACTCLHALWVARYELQLPPLTPAYYGIGRQERHLERQIFLPLYTRAPPSLC